jgi:hypothetical protein
MVVRSAFLALGSPPYGSPKHAWRLMPSQSLSQLPVDNTSALALAVALDPDFEARWAAWVARGELHERLVRRKLALLGAALALGGAIFSVFSGDCATTS